MKTNLRLRMAAVVLAMLFGLAPGILYANGGPKLDPRTQANFSLSKEFYFTFIENLKQDEPQNAHQLTVFVASNYKTKGTIEVLGLGKTTTWKQSFTVDSMSVAEINIPTGFNNTTEIIENDDEKPLRHAVHVTADNPIVVYALNHIKYTTDGFLVIPPSAWGTDYSIASYSGITRTAALPTIRSTSEFAIVSAFDNTNVNILLTDNSMVGPAWGISHAKGTSVNVTLMKGEVYQMQSWKNGAEINDFSGTIITASHPIGVISGAKCTDVPVGKQACDHIVEMLPPTDTWGKEYFTYPFEPSRKGGDLWRCFALEPNTQVKLNGSILGFIDPADPVTPYFETTDFARSELKTAAHWEFSKPVLMCQYICGQDADGSDHGDPSMVVLETREQFERGVVFACPSDQYGFTPQASPNGGNFLNIIVNDVAGGLSGLRDSLTLDDKYIKDLPGPAFLLNPAPAPVPGTTFWAYHLRIPGGVHRLKGKSDFSAYLVGFRDYESYAWATALALKKIGRTDTLHPLIPTKLTCGELIDTIQDVPHDSTMWALAQFANDGNGIGWLHDPAPNNTVNFDDNILFDQSFVPGDSVARIHIKVTNLRQNAHGALYVVDRGGNDTVYMYNYVADTVATAPLYVFGNVSPPATKTLPVVIHNPMDSSVTVDSLLFVKGSVFSFAAPVPKFPLVIKKGDSVIVNVKYAPTGGKADTLVDSINVKFNCFTRWMTSLSGGSTKPCVAITDDTNDVQTISGGIARFDSVLIITNPGTGPLTINKITITGPGAVTYSLGPEINLPLTPATQIVIPAFGSDTIKIHFSATSVGTYDAEITLFTDAICAEKDTLAELSTPVVAPGPQIKGFDFKTVRVNCTYTDNGLTVTNSGTAADGWSGLNPPTANPEFVLNNKPGFTAPIGPKGSGSDTILVNVTFKPTKVGPRAVNWNALFTSSGNAKIPVADSGIGKWPQFATASPIDFGNVDVNASNILNAIAVNVQKQYGDSITIKGITIDDSVNFSFTTPGPTYPIVMPIIGDTTYLPVQFTPKSAGNKTAQLCFTYDGAFNTCHGDTTVCITLKGVGQLPGIDVTPKDFQRVFITTTRKDTVLVENHGGAPVIVTGLSLASGLNFAIDNDPSLVPPNPALPFTVPAFGSVVIHVKFTPTDTISNPYWDSIIVTNQSLNPRVTNWLTGIGKVVIYTSSVTLGKNIHGTYGKETDIPIYILDNGYTRPSVAGLPVDKTPLDSGLISKLHLSLSYDRTVLTPMTADEKCIDLAGSIIPTYTAVRKPSPASVGNISSILFDLNGGPVLTGTGGLVGNVKFNTLYAPTDSMRLYDTITTDQPWVQWKHVSGLFILDSICGMSAASKIVYVGGASLQQSIPNPAVLTNGVASVSIPFALDRDMTVKLVMYNAMGKEVSEMFNGQLPKGAYSVPFNLDQVPAGLYYYRLAAEGTVQTRTMMVVH